MKSYLMRLVMCLMLIQSATSVASTIGTFSVTGSSGYYDTNNSYVDSGNAQFNGSATLSDLGVLSIIGSLETFVPSSAIDGLGDISTSISSEMTLQGDLATQNLSATLTNLSITDYNTLNCTDTGSTGIFSGNACTNLQEPSIFNIFTDTVNFTLLVGSVSSIDWNASSALVGELTSQQLVNQTELTAVPLPAGVWFFLSSLIGLGLAKKKHSLVGEA